MNKFLATIIASLIAVTAVAVADAAPGRGRGKKAISSIVVTTTTSTTTTTLSEFAAWCEDHCPLELEAPEVIDDRGTSCVYRHFRCVEFDYYGDHNCQTVITHRPYPCG